MSENSRLTVVPAQRGFDLVEPSFNDKGVVESLVFIPIVAWVVEVFCRNGGNAGDDYAGSVAYPVTVQSAIDSDYGTVIRTPIGRFVFCEHTYVDDEAVAIAEFNRLRASAGERHAKAPTAKFGSAELSHRSFIHP
jgi:hypothetical protein